MACKLGILADNHFVIYKDKVYVNGTYSQNYLKRYTNTFDEVIVIARAYHAKNEEEVVNLRLSGGERVSFYFLNDFYGIKNYIVNRRKIKNQLLECLKTVDAILVRMPSLLTNITIKCSKKVGIPFFIDVAADPETIYRSFHTSFLELILSYYMKSKCKKACLEAKGVTYVTSYTLQKKYPCLALTNSVENITASISNVDLSDDFYFTKRDYSDKLINIKLLHISNNIVKNTGKGQIEALNVLCLLLKKGYNASLVFLGDGDGIDELKKIAKKMNIYDNVIFKGRITNRDEYKKELLENNIFLFPSHAEGLPRCLIEAMATGMICIASNVDGIPELLDSKDIYDYSNIYGFVSRIEEYAHNISECVDASRRNIKKAYEYSNKNLMNIYSDYYNRAKELISGGKK